MDASQRQPQLIFRGISAAVKQARGIHVIRRRRSTPRKHRTSASAMSLSARLESVCRAESCRSRTPHWRGGIRPQQKFELTHCPLPPFGSALDPIAALSARRSRKRRSASKPRRSAIYHCTAGRLETAAGVGLFRHIGCPNPPLLIPVPPYGFGVMSKIMLSGCLGSPETPPTLPELIQAEPVAQPPADHMIGA